MAQFHHCSIYNQHQSMSILVNIMRNTKAITLLFGQHGSVSSLFNLQSTSINFNFGQYYAKYQCYSLTFGHNGSFSSPFNLESKCINFNFAQFSAKYQGYSLTFWPKLAQCYHVSIYIQNQSLSMLFIFRQTIRAIALLFGQTWHIFITFQSTININQFQFWSFSGKLPRL